MKDLLRSMCDIAAKRGASFADVRVVESENTGIMRQDGRADKLDQSASRGLGVRALKDHAWGFASASDFDRDSAMDALDAAISMAEASAERTEQTAVARVEGIEDIVRAQVELDPRSVPVETKMAALQGFEESAIKLCGDKLANSIISYSDEVQREIVCNTFGAYVDTESIRTSAQAIIIVSDGGIIQRATDVIGSPVGFELMEKATSEEFSLKAAKLALSLLTASPPPAGNFPVIFHPSLTGVFTHECIGHNAEADLVMSGSSIIAGKMGQQIGSDLVTIIDDATIPGAWGSYAYDSEGTPGQRRVLIENGVLKNYMHSLETAARMGMAPNGSARAQGYSSRPIIRMSNTFIAPGTSELEDMIRGINLGVYLKSGQYGHVNPERGQYTCHAGEAYMIRNGELAEHLRDVSVAGLTLDTLMNIDAVSDDFEMKEPGTCGKNGQGMHVDMGGAHVRVKELVVGGRS
ncbi:MAG: TldD/PmbA family protein [Armatimonadetes bacterium]|nr:TldD/PmbA family protein [Armatimonadota bacterium]